MDKSLLPALLLSATVVAPSVRAAEPPQRTSESAVEEITRLTTVEWPQASMRGDVQWFDRHYADELLITNGQTGELTTKTEALSSFGAPQQAGGTSKIEDLRINVYGNVAVTAFGIDVSGNDNNRPYHRFVRNTEVWVFRDGRWQLVSLHSTPLPQHHCCPMEISPER
jgi:ketosteroid isomerase-like protein